MEYLQILKKKILKNENYESYDVKSDSLIFYENISKFSNDKNFIKNFLNI